MTNWYYFTEKKNNSSYFTKASLGGLKKLTQIQIQYISDIHF